MKNSLRFTHHSCQVESFFLEMFLEETLVRHRHSLSPHCSHHMPFTPTTVNTSCFPFSITHTLTSLPTHHSLEQQHIHTLSHSFLPTHYCPEQQHIAVQCVGSKIKCQNKNSKTLKSEHSAKLMQPQQCQVSQIDKKELKFARKQMFTLGLPSAVL